MAKYIGLALKSQTRGCVSIFQSKPFKTLLRLLALELKGITNKKEFKKHVRGKKDSTKGRNLSVHKTLKERKSFYRQVVLISAQQAIRNKIVYCTCPTELNIYSSSFSAALLLINNFMAQHKRPLKLRNFDQSSLYRLKAMRNQPHRIRLKRYR